MSKYVNDAIRAFNERKFSDSQDLFDRAFRVAPANEKARVLIRKGRILMQLQDKRPAHAAFLRAIAIDPL